MNRAQLDTLLASAFKIRPGEARQVGLMFLYLMGVVSTFIIGRTVRDTLFLKRVPLEQLPLMYVLAAAAVALASYAYSRIADRHRRDRLILGALSATVALVSTLWALLSSGLAGGWIYPALYVVIEVVGALSIIQFWTFANDVFSGRQAKRLFGVVGAGGVFANVVCGFGIGAIAPMLGPVNLLLVVAAIFLSCTFAVRAVARRAAADLDAAIRRPRAGKIGLASDTGAVLHSRHLKLIAGIVALTFVTVTIIDYQFKVLVRGTFTSEKELAAYFGYFYGFTGIVSSAIQFLVTGRLLERAGIVVALSVLPASLLGGAAAIALVPLVAPAVAATLAKGAENVFRYTINDATLQLLYVPVPSHQRGRAKAFIDGILKPASIALAGLALFGLGRWREAGALAHDLAWLDLALVAAWLGAVLGIRREYVSSLLETLHARRLDPGGDWSTRVDDQTLRLLRARLGSSSTPDVLHALELVPHVQADFGAQVLALLEHPETAVRVQALTILGQSGRYQGLARIRALMRDPLPEVRAAAVGATCALLRDQAVREAAPLLRDRAPAVRGAVIAALVNHGGLDGILAAASSLKDLLESPRAEDRLEGARVLAAIRVRTFFQPVLVLLQDPELPVRLAAIEAAAQMRSPELVPPLIYKLADPRAGEAAVRALVAHGDGIQETLFKVLQNRREDPAIRRRVPRVLGMIGGPPAALRLIDALDDPDPELRRTTARAIARIREREPSIKVDDARLDEVIRREVREAYQALAIITDLGLPPDHLLPEALLRRHQRKLGLAFRLLEIRYPARTIQLVYTNLDSQDRAVRANALEVADNVLSKEESRLLLPLLEDLPIADRIAAGEARFELERRDADAWVTRLLEDPEPWVVACALQLVRERQLGAVVEQVARAMTSRDVVVRETACFTMMSLLRMESPVQAPEFTRRAETLRRLAHRVSVDAVPEVRRAGEALLAMLVPAV